MRSRLRAAVVLLLTVGLLAFFLRGVNLSEVWEKTREADPRLLLAGVGVTLYSYFDGVHDPRLGMLGLTLVALGVQGGFASFFLSILGLSEHAVLRRRSLPDR